MSNHRHHMNTPIAIAVAEAFDKRNTHRVIRQSLPKEERIAQNSNTLPVAIHIERVLNMPTSKFH